jgi:biopolymer transport protein ExbD
MRLAKRKKKRGQALELNLVSMIDVIFLLLIFFLVNLGFSRSERELQASLRAQAEAGRRANVEPVVVECLPAGGGFEYKVSARKAADVPALTLLLRQIPSKANGAFVRVNDAVPFGFAAGAVQAVTDAGFSSVQYLPAAGR